MKELKNDVQSLDIDNIEVVMYVPKVDEYNLILRQIKGILYAPT